MRLSRDGNCFIFPRYPFGSNIMEGMERGVLLFMENDFQIEKGILKSYTGRQEQVIVPEEVHTIGEDAFKGCVSLRKVVLPAGLVHILSGAFKGCRRLKEIAVPPGVTHVGEYAFHRCHSLESVSLPPSVTELGDCAFLYCDSLTEVRIPGVRYLGKQVFVNDVMLKKLEISPKLQEDCLCDVFTGCSRISEIAFSDGRQYVFPNAVEVVAGEMAVPGLVRAIAVDILRMMELEGRCLAKFLTNLKHVEIPEGIEKIGKSAFFDKRGIISVQFPSTLKEIESRAFRNCISLETVAFRREENVIHEDAFQNCSALREVRTPEGASFGIEGISGLSGEDIPVLVRTVRKQVLGNFRLSGSILLKYLGNESRVVVPEGVVRIAEEAFAGNEGVDRVILPDSVETIGAGAFRDCLVLQSVNFPARLGHIGTGAFENCVKLLRAPLPEGLTEVGAKAFKRCRRLKELGLGKGVWAIGEQAFYGCSALGEVRFPDSLVSLGDMAFYRCKALKEVQLPPGTEAVGNLAFAQSGVKRVRMEGCGRGYGRDIFFQCPGLRNVVLERGVRHIPDRLAYGCGALNRVVLPDTLESVGRNVWEGTPFLKDWVEKQLENQIEDRLENQQKNRQESRIEDETRNQPESRKEDRTRNGPESRIEEKQWNGSENQIGPGKRTENKAERQNEIFWDGRHLKGIVSLPEETRIVAGGAFYGNQFLTEIHFSNHVTWIGEAALKGCTKLCRVTWPKAVTTAEPEVFSGCTRLETIALCPDSPESAELQDASFAAAVPWKAVKDRAFYNCRKLSHILWKDIRTVGKEAFFGCVSLKPEDTDSLEWVGELAFEGMQGMETAESMEGQNAREAADGAACKDRESRDGTSGLCIVGSILVSGGRCPGEVHVPEGITVIAPYAFSANRQITGLVLPETLRSIGEGAFWGCSGLAHVRFPSSSCAVGPRAFEKCTGIQEIRLRAHSLGASAFARCLSLERAEITGLSALEERLFEGCENLRECVCGQVSAVGDSCFSGCRQLENFDFQMTIEIGSYAFQDCDMLKEIGLNDQTKVHPHGFEDCGRLERIVLTGKEGSLELCEYAFSGCTALNQVVRRGRLWELREYRDILSEKLPEPVRLIFHSALSCFEVEKEEILCGYRGLGRILKIPAGIRRIQAEVFQDCLMLEQISIPETVEYIGARAFHKTAWMEKQRAKSPMVVVGHMLLDGSCCAGEVVIPEDIRLVCGWAFAGGMGIEKIRFLSDRVRVEAYAFRNCIFLKELVLADGTSVVFEGISDRKKELPTLAEQAVWDRLNCFKTDENDVLIECTGNISRLLVAEGITAIGDSVFQDGNLLTEIILPRTVTSIGRNSFAGCRWLLRVCGAEGVRTIGSRAFSGCGSLEEVALAESLTEIGRGAFENCTSLREIVLPEGVEELPERVFFRCHSLRRVHLPSTLKRIGKEAFAFCRSLEMLTIPEGVLVEERAFAGTVNVSQERMLP